MKCPHCLKSFHPQWQNNNSLITDNDYRWGIKYQACPGCNKAIIILQEHFKAGGIRGEWIVYPKATNRPISTYVPESYAKDFNEACLVLNDSPKASAALSRRSLQNLLREKAGVKPSDLSKEIDEVLASGKLPSHLAESIDAVRNIGNFAAHPLKSTNTGEIIDIESGEAEWLLDVLESLFDFYFVQPAILQKKRDALNAKLKEAGKPPMK